VDAPDLQKLSYASEPKVGWFTLLSNKLGVEPELIFVTMIFAALCLSLMAMMALANALSD
jgi:hypothetical protein